MNKAILGLGVTVLVTAGAGAGAAFYLGNKTHDYLDEATNKIAAQMPFVRVAKIEHGKGILNSTRTTTLNLGCAGSDGKPPFSLQVKENIQHGPFPGWNTAALTVIDSEILLPAQAQEVVGAFFNGKPLYTARTVVGFDGSYRQTVSIPAGQMTKPDGSKIIWHGMTGTASGHKDKAHYTVDATSNGFEASNAKDGAFLKIGRMHLKGEGELALDALWAATGKSEFIIDSAEAAFPSPSGQAFKLKMDKVRFGSDTTLQQELLTSTSRFSASATFNDVKLDEIEMQASVKRLHRPTFTKVMQHMFKTAFTCEALRNPNAGPEMIQAMQSDLMQLLPHNPEYGLDKLRVVYAGKEASVSYTLGVNGVTAEDIKDLQPATMIPLLMPKMMFKAEGKLPIAWIGQMMAAMPRPASQSALQPEVLAGMLQTAAAQGWIIKEGEYISSRFLFSNGQMLLNDKPFQPPVPTTMADSSASMAREQ
ncbi:MAG: YdgA family protein [Burkholderiales bacterium]